MTARLLCLALIALAAGCAKKRPTVAPSATEQAVRCTNTMWQVGQIRPANVEVINLSSDSVIVFVERCDGHSRVADIGPRDTLIAPLPNGASSFMGLLRFFTYRGPARLVAIEVAAPEGAPHVRLVLPSEITEACPRIFVNGKPYTAAMGRLKRESIVSMDVIQPKDPRECIRIEVRTSFDLLTRATFQHVDAPEKPAL